jgi:myosin heavy subunit
MKETVAIGVHKEATVNMDNKVGDMVSKETDVLGNRVEDMVTRDTEVMGNKVVDMATRAMEVTGNKADMVNKDMDSKADMATRDTEVMDNKVDMATRDTVDSKADGDNMKGMGSKVVVRSTAAMDNNMKVNTVKTGIMAEQDMMRTMNPGCRDATVVGKKKIMIMNMMKTRMTITVCRVSMKMKKMMSMMKMKTIMAGKPLCNKDVRAVGLAVCHTKTRAIWVASNGMTRVICQEDVDNHQAVLLSMNQITALMVLLTAVTGVLAVLPNMSQIMVVRAEAIPAIPAVVLPVCQEKKLVA